MSRVKFLRSIGADTGAAEELNAYCSRNFNVRATNENIDSLLMPEPHVAVWRQYAREAEQYGVFRSLQKRLVQLRFPICAGISQSDMYRAATRRGIWPSDSPGEAGLQLEQPHKLRLLIHDSLAGPIPVLIPSGRTDFVAILQSLGNRNEPVPIPDAMGATLISGFNNWDRIHKLRDRWQAEQADEMSDESWEHEFHNNIVPKKELYHDRFIILSDGPYSGTAAEDLGLSKEEWRRLSLTIRLEHECTHYFTQRYLGSAQNHLLDELIADYRGIVAAIGHFRADWFLRFMGLESYPEYRTSGRLGYYRGDPPLSQNAFAILQTLVKLAAENLERADRTFVDQQRTTQSQLRLLMTLTRLTLVELASDDASSQLEQAFG